MTTISLLKIQLFKPLHAADHLYSCLSAVLDALSFYFHLYSIFTTSHFYFLTPIFTANYVYVCAPVKVNVYVRTVAHEANKRALDPLKR